MGNSNVIKRQLLVEGIKYDFVANLETEEVSVTTESDENFQIIAMGDEIQSRFAEEECSTIIAMFEAHGTKGLPQGIAYTEYDILDSLSWEEENLVKVHHVIAVRAYLKAKAIQMAIQFNF